MAGDSVELVSYPGRTFRPTWSAGRLIPSVLPAAIEDTHRRMAAAFHPTGVAWARGNMPRTVTVFLNQQPGLSTAERRAAAREEAGQALRAYWRALEGTIDPKKVEDATDNAVVGDAEEVAAQIVQRFHPEERLMLWFDFFNHDSHRVVQNQEAFMAEVAPRVESVLGT